jgi:hypothetical protein
MSFGVTGEVAPNATSPSVAKYSRAARTALSVASRVRGRHQKHKVKLQRCDHLSEHDKGGCPSRARAVHVDDDLVR